MSPSLRILWSSKLLMVECSMVNVDVWLDMLSVIRKFFNGEFHDGGKVED